MARHSVRRAPRRIAPAGDPPHACQMSATVIFVVSGPPQRSQHVRFHSNNEQHLQRVSEPHAPAITMIKGGHR
jgi:hypothetical protein